VFYGVSLRGSVRPIAIGSTLRRLAGKAACRSVKDKTITKPAPYQFDFGVRFGAKATVHAARSFLLNHDRGQALFKIDFSNAFNNSTT
jgi:hypothetical protein